MKNAIVLSALSTLQGLEEMGGVSSTEEYISEVELLISELNKRVSNARKTLQGKLSVKTREELGSYVFDCMMSGMFGDGVEDEYCWDGTTIQGINEMTDAELIDYAESYCSPQEELIERAKAELAVEEMIK